MTDERSISVLLVDDNEPWAQFLAQSVTRQAGNIQVSVVTSPNQALQTLQNTDEYDCVVTDHQMPEVTGLELLKRLRAKDFEIPIIMYTSVGNEDLASKAIQAGASDYIIKNPKTDQTSIFERRINNSIKQYRLEQSIKESEERYRTVTEQSTDAILIVQNSKSVFCNQRFYDLVEYDESELDSFDLVSTIVHPEDQDHVRAVINDWYEGTDIGPLQEARIVTANGDLRYWELAGQQITHQDDSAILISARDITERKRRNRELEWEKKLNRNVQKALIDTKTPKGLLEAICDQLCEYGYDFVWTGQLVDDEIQPQVIRGDDTAYVSETTFGLEGNHDTEPSVWAARTREPQFINDFADLFASEWRDAAIEAGYRSGAAIPLLHENVFYGVLVVYDSRTDQFDKTERTLLESLCDTVAFAIHSFETQHALSAQHAVELVLGLHESEYYLVDIARTPELNLEDSCITVAGTVPQDASHNLQYVNVPKRSRDAFVKLAHEHPSIEEITPLSENGERFKIVVTEPSPESKLAEMGAVVRGTTIDQSGAEIQIESPTRREARRLIDRVKNEFPQISVQSLADIDRDRSPTQGEQSITSDLTDKQREAYRVAYFEGYFENPRESSATDIAESLGISHSTFLQHLRAAQKKMASHLYG